MKVPTNIVITLDVRADDPAGVRQGLIATLNALRDQVEPNTLWGNGYCVGIRNGSGG